MNIEIDKKKAWERIKAGTLINFIILIFVVFFSVKLFSLFLVWSELGGQLNNKVYSYGFLFVITIQIGTLISNWLWLENVVYQAEPDKLTETYTIITKRINQARLQVVNDVNITQSIYDRFFGKFFNLEVNYGFGDVGYTFIYKYLSEEKANELSEFIKAKGRGIDLK